MYWTAQHKQGLKQQQQKNRRAKSPNQNITLFSYAAAKTILRENYNMQIFKGYRVRIIKNLRSKGAQEGIVFYLVQLKKKKEDFT